MLGIWLSGSNTRRAECAAEHEQASDIIGPAPAPAEEDARGAVVAAAAFRSINRVAPRCTTCGLFHHSPLSFGMLRAQLVQASVEGATIGRRRRLQRCCGGAADAQQGQDEQLETIHLSKNQLTGTIPDAIGTCAMLKTLDLASNKIEGRQARRSTDRSSSAFQQ